MKVVKDYFRPGVDAYFILLWKNDEGDAFYASRFNIVSEELVDLDDML